MIRSDCSRTSLSAGAARRSRRQIRSILKHGQVDGRWFGVLVGNGHGFAGTIGGPPCLEQPGGAVLSRSGIGQDVRPLGHNAAQRPHWPVWRNAGHPHPACRVQPPHRPRHGPERQETGSGQSRFPWPRQTVRQRAHPRHGAVRKRTSDGAEPAECDGGNGAGQPAIRIGRACFGAARFSASSRLRRSRRVRRTARAAHCRAARPGCRVLAGRFMVEPLRFLLAKSRPHRKPPGLQDIRQSFQC